MKEKVTFEDNMSKLSKIVTELEKGDKVKIRFGNGGAEAEITDKW